MTNRPASETRKRLDDLEEQVGELVERVQRLAAELDQHRGRGPVDVALPEDVPQNVRTGRGGEDRPHWSGWPA